MFYQCPECKKIWQQPVGKCPECFILLERMPAGKAKVIGLSKVIIPSLAHPKVPYFAVLLEDETGNRWAQKSFKEYKIGEKFSVSENGGGDPRTVAIWRIKYDIMEAVEKIVGSLGGVEIDGRTKVLIIPALNSPKHSYFAENTSPEFLEETIKFLLAKGALTENIKVGSQSFNDIPIEASAQKSGLLDVCLNFKIMPFDLAKGNFEKKGDLEIAGEVFKADLIVNLPILKIGQAGSCENLFKFLKKENYLGQKYLYSQKEILGNLKKYLPQVLTIAQADNVQKPDKFVRYLGLALAGFDALAVDRVFNDITSNGPLPEMLSGVKIEEIPVVGRTVEEAKFNS